jgi:hypothetical protein
MLPSPLIIRSGTGPRFFAELNVTSPTTDDNFVAVSAVPEKVRLAVWSAP